MVNCHTMARGYVFQTIRRRELGFSLTNPVRGHGAGMSGFQALLQLVRAAKRKLMMAREMSRHQLKKPPKLVKISWWV
jgi:hypothetical protein